MLSLPYLAICLYCMLQLGFLLVMDIRRRNTRSVKERYFAVILIIMLCSFTADIFSSLDGYPDWFFPFSAAGNYIEVILNTVILLIYFRYVCAQISNLNLILKGRMNLMLWICGVTCAIMVISTAFNKQIFYYDEEGLYHRGPLFWIPMLVLFVMMVLIEVFVISQRAKIEKNYFRSLILFLIFPLIGWALQLFIFGLPFSLISAAFSAMVVFINIQNRSMDTDYLTGVFNRQALDRQMQSKIEAAKSRSFSALMLDIDNFKTINDTFGHYEGDRILIHSAHLLRHCISHKDYIARYGGDEFCIIFDTEDVVVLEGSIQKIRNMLLEFNQNSRKPYTLDFSIGYAVYDSSIGERAEQFLKVIDRNMYKEKNLKRKIGQIEGEQT